jgi:glycosyltransferase involved in cell wall biosynthesis
MMLSVCMAVRNGANFIREQIESILPQLSEDDELVIVDDASKDETIAIVRSFGDQRVRIVQQERNLGVVRSFSRALEEARGEIIFLTDHDDLWRADKVEKFLETFTKHLDVTLALSDLVIVDAEGNIVSEPRFANERFHPGVVQNIVRNRYHGSSMAFRRVVLDHCLPFPADIHHDQWIGLVNQFVGKAEFIPEPLLYYRRHGKNDSRMTHAPLGTMLRWRWTVVKKLTEWYVHHIVRGKRPADSRGDRGRSESQNSAS